MDEKILRQTILPIVILNTKKLQKRFLAFSIFFFGANQHPTKM